MTFDEIRAKFPAFGFALYAYEPGGPVKFEVLDPAGTIWEFSAETEQAVLERAFAPEQPPEEPAPAPAPPALLETDDWNVFD